MLEEEETKILGALLFIQERRGLVAALSQGLTIAIHIF